MSEGSYLNNDLNMTDGFSVILFSSASQLLAHRGAHKALMRRFFFISNQRSLSTEKGILLTDVKAAFHFRAVCLSTDGSLSTEFSCSRYVFYQACVKTWYRDSILFLSFPQVLLDAKIIAGRADWVALNFWIKLLMVSSYMNIFCQNWLSIKSDINSH